MKKVICVGIFAVSCAGVLSLSALSAYDCWRSSKNVYSISAYAGGYLSGPSWHVGGNPKSFGYSEYTEVGMPSEWGKKRDTPTFTEIDFASRHFTIKASILQLKIGGGLVMLIIAALAAVAMDCGKRVKTDD